MRCKVSDHHDRGEKFYVADVCSLAGNTEFIITFCGKKRPTGAQEFTLYRPDFHFYSEAFDVTGWVRLKEPGDGHFWELHSFTVLPSAR